MVSLDGKTCSVPQFIGAPQHIFKTTNLGIKSSAPLALDGWVNPSDTLVPAVRVTDETPNDIGWSFRGLK